MDCHWLDAFSLPSGAAWIIAGGIAGHDLHAAIRLEEVRTTIRAIALETDSPARALEHADRALQLSKDSGPIQIACAAAVAPYDELRISSAGHPPPMFLTPGQPPTPVELGHSEPPLGVLPGPRRTSITIPFPPGSVILAYTSGVIEGPRSFSGTNIADVCATVRDAPPDQLSNTVLDAIRQQRQGDFHIGITAMRRRAPV